MQVHAAWLSDGGKTFKLRYTFQQEPQAEDQAQDDTCSNMHLIHLFQEPENKVKTVKPKNIINVPINQCTMFKAGKTRKMFPPLAGWYMTAIWTGQ